MYVHLVYDITVVFEDLPDVDAGCLHLAAGAYGTPFVLCSTEKVIKGIRKVREKKASKFLDGAFLSE